MIRNYENLASAIILKVVKDYRRALRTLLKHPLEPKADGNRVSIEQFFRSEYFAVMTDLDPQALIERLNREVDG